MSSNPEIEKQRILIVDDTIMNIKTIIPYLNAYGFETIVAHSGEEGMEKAFNHLPDLILLDVMMPDLDGFEVCRILKADRTTKNIPIIFMTALDDLEDKIEGFALGAVDYITKPFQQKEVLIRVKTHLKIQAQTKELKRQAIALAQAKEQAEIARQHAEKANQLKNVFLANISYDLRTPLTSILGFSQLMLRSQSLPTEHIENANIIHHSGEYLLHFIDDVLDLSKIEAGLVSYNPKIFSLQHLLNDLEEMFHLKATEKQLQLSIECDPQIGPYIQTDELKLRQILINLLDNALKLTNTGGIYLKASLLTTKTSKITFNTSTTKSGVQQTIQFKIEDTGPGIDPTKLDTLFEPFAQTMDSTQVDHNLALRLPMSHKFIELLGGDITVSSPPPQPRLNPKTIAPHNNGTLFTFNIKVSAIITKEDQTEETTASTNNYAQNHIIALEPNQPHYRILIVDSNAYNRQLFIKLLTPLGFGLKEANTNQQAITIWQTWQPHLIWLDVQASAINGYTVAQQIKTTIKTQQLKIKTAIIALLTNNLAEEKETALSTGCDDVLLKPFQQDNVFDLMHKHIGVRYIYAKDVKHYKPEKEKKLSFESLALKMTALPLKLLTNLENATLKSDMALIDSLLTEIKPYNSILAKELTQLADNFDYDKILTLIQQAKKNYD